ncbi:MAG: MFS transporter [Acidobacteria bacterium]|nr:MFS transporter [Acidobacteriota bacterium]
MPRCKFYGWKLLSALWIVVFINLAFPIYGSRGVEAVMMQAMDLNRQTLGSIFSIFTVMSGLPGPLVALCVGRFGVRITMLAGSLLIVIGSVLMATAVNSGMTAALVFGVVVGIGVATGGVIAAQAVLVKWFVRRRALVLAILSSASGVGGFVAAPLLNRVVELGGGSWRAGWWFMAALSCFAAVIAVLFLKESPEELGQAPDGGAFDSASAQDCSGARSRRVMVHRTREIWSYRESLSGPVYWLLMVCQMGMSWGFIVFLSHGVVHLMDLGHAREAAAWAISLIALIGLAAKGVVAVFGDRIEPRYIWGCFIGIFGVGQLLVIKADSTGMMVAAAACIGIGFSGGVVCMATVLSNYFGTKPFASLSGLTIAVNTTMGAIAPFVAGRLYDGGYGYQGVFYTIAAWCAAGAVVMFLIKPPFKKKVSTA